MAKTKRELLQDLTVKELKNLCRKKDLSGYSSMRKDELVDFLYDNYTKDEVKKAKKEKAKEEIGKVVDKPKKMKVKKEKKPKKTTTKSKGKLEEKEHFIKFVDKAEKFLLSKKHRLGVSLVGALVIALFSPTKRVCFDGTCINHFVSFLFNPFLFGKPLAWFFIIKPFLQTFFFFTLLWFIILTIGAYLQRNSFFERHTIPIVLLGLYIYMFLLIVGLL